MRSSRLRGAAAFTLLLSSACAIFFACAETGPDAPSRNNAACVREDCNDATPPGPGPGPSVDRGTDGPLVYGDPLEGTTKAAQLVNGGFQFTEGPVWIGGKLLFTEIPPSRIHELLDDGGTAVWRSGTNGTNGLAVHPNGDLIACQHFNHRVTKSPATPAGGGMRTNLATTFDRKMLNSPNDVIVRKDGNIYFTDPDFAAAANDPDAGTSRQDKQAIFRIAPNGDLSRIKEVDSKPNGIALSPDDNLLYVADSMLDQVAVWDVDAAGVPSNERKFVDTAGGPDGMAVDLAGNVYVSSEAGIEVFSKTGGVVGVISLPGNVKATNCTFGGADGRTLYITANASQNANPANGLYSIKLNVPGLP